MFDETPWVQPETHFDNILKALRPITDMLCNMDCNMVIQASPDQQQGTSASLHHDEATGEEEQLHVPQWTWDGWKNKPTCTVFLTCQVQQGCAIQV